MKTKWPSTLALLAGSAWFALAGGCASSREVKVDALARPAASGRELKSYTIRTKTPGSEADQLRGREAVEYVKTALSAQGMWESPDAEAADLVVEVDFGIEPARVRYETTRMPVFVRVRNEEAELPRRASRGGEDERVNPALPVQRRLVGYEEVATPVMVREKHLTVSARESGPVVEGRPPPEVFRVSAKIEDESTDLRGTLPLLAAAVMDQIGRTTEGSASTTMRENDSAVGFIERGM